MAVKADSGSDSFPREKYIQTLAEFDGASCEAISVSNATPSGETTWLAGHIDRIFTRMACHLVALMCAAPLSRWVKKDFEIWDFAEVAGHLRAIMEGYVLFRYLAASAGDKVVEQAASHQIFLYDCTTRLERLATILADDDKKHLRSEKIRIKSVLTKNSHFLSFPQLQREKLLEGKTMTLASRDKLLDQFGLERKEFYLLWDLTSQHMHLLSLAFMNMESNGRGTGVENDADRSYIGMGLRYCLPLVLKSTDMMVDRYPNLAKRRQGVSSVFSPGPKSNSPL